MKQITTKTGTTLLMAVLLCTGAITGFADLELPTRKSLNLPPMWKQVSSAQRLQCVIVAKFDAYRALAERIYGFEIAAGTTIYDFMLESDRVKNCMKAVLKGAVEIKKPYYTDDGIVYIGYGVNYREIHEIIEKEIKREGKLKKITINYSRTNEDRLIEALGNGALPDSKGLKMIRAKRAAELDAFRKMAERFVGVKIDSRTTVRDMCLESDTIQGSVIAFLRGLKPMKVEYLDDDSCDVTMRLKVREVIETVEKITRFYGKGNQVTKETIRNANQSINDRTFSVTGHGAPREDSFTPPTSINQAIDPDKAYLEERTILRKIISKRIITE